MRIANIDIALGATHVTVAQKEEQAPRNGHYRKENICQGPRTEQTKAEPATEDDGGQSPIPGCSLTHFINSRYRIDVFLVLLLSFTLTHSLGLVAVRVTR